MNQPIRILQVLTHMNRGGAETMVMNYYRALDKSRYQFDFLVHRHERGAYDDEIENLGGRIFRAFPIRPWNYVSYFRFLDNFFKDHPGEFIAVHSHIQDNSGFVFKYAAKYGIERRISTSHIASYDFDLKLIFRKFGQWYGNKFTTHRLACGLEAGKLLYGNRPFEIFKNAIDVQSFIYEKDKANIFKNIHNWTNKLIIGNVARFCPQKNHRGLIDIFEAIHKEREDSILVLVGGGELEQDIKNLVHNKGLQDVVFFEGIRNDVSSYLSVFDVFLFPSLYEGLPVSIIEAQASGLKCVLSDTIDRETDITGNVTFISLSSSPVDWAKKILTLIPYNRESNYRMIASAGYDVKQNIDRLLDIYLSAS